MILQSMDLVGTPYRWGGTTDTGFDCSGMIQYLYKNTLNVNLPRTSRQMAEASRSINPSKLKSGDLVFFNTSGRGISHVGLYIGNGEFIHAPSTGSTVRTERLDKPYYAKRLVKAGTFFSKNLINSEIKNACLKDFQAGIFHISNSTASQSENLNF